ncbi:hypothetical protein BDP27DRAFT_1369780 [Rhodocollybia butyracea]|uniref:Uncharacterized protein n=1 Tax=Rhodocollybia butyracea TaxID=206335 RepID=A0A9P5PDQ9_9AGAR|nr:hypothetical protein BDP27DRAFT_1369780 [Rhodocollybia butyracea]
MTGGYLFSLTVSQGISDATSYSSHGKISSIHHQIPVHVSLFMKLARSNSWVPSSFHITTGFAILGVLIAIWLLKIKTWREPKAIQLFCCMVIVLITTGSIVMTSFIDISQVKLGIIEEVLNAPSDIIILNDIADFCGTITVLVGDFVICWRAWVLLLHDKFWRFLLVIIMAGNIGVNIADCVFDTAAVNVLGKFSTLDSVSIVLSLAVNMVATGLIAWKAWY